MAWVYLDGKTRTTPIETFIDMTVDGIYAWLLYSDGMCEIVNVYNNLNINDPIKNYLSYIVATNITYGNGKIFLTNNTKLVIINATSFDVEQVIDLPSITNCVPEYGNFKIWFTSEYIDANNKETLFYYDLTNNDFSMPVELQGAKQLKSRKIRWANDTFVWVTGYNETSVYKYNDNDGSFVAQVIVNRKPEVITSNNNREVVVGSFNGMISSVDQTTNVATNIAGVIETPVSLYDDGTNLYSITSIFGITDKTSTTDNRREMNGQTAAGVPVDFAIVDFSDKNFKQVHFAKSMTIPTWDKDLEIIVNKVEPARTLLLTDNKFYAAYNLTDTWNLNEIRPYYLDVRATTIIGTGPDVYFGETA